jgi:hypothetical protein
MDVSFVYEVRQPRVVVGIMAEWQQMETLVKASKDTWIKQLSYDVFYFVGASSLANAALTRQPNMIVLPYDDHEYPPIKKTFAMWYYFYANLSTSYDYFVAVDTDTYVNVKQLETMIKQLNCSDCYVGYPAWGARREQGRLGIHAPFCYGFGYVISRSTLLQFGPHINNCQMSVVAKHSDTEMGRCIYHYAHNLSCSRPAIPFDVHLYTANEKNEVVRVKRNRRRQLQIDFPQSPPTRFFQAVMVHPLKNPQFFYTFHQQVVLHLRPILSPVFAAGSCVANPIIQREIYPYRKYIPECPPLKTNQSIDIKSVNAFVLTSPGYDQHVPQLIDAFDQHGIRVQRFDTVASFTRPTSTKLTVEQWRLRLMMTRFFHAALAMNLERVLVLEDDAIPHRHFGSRLQKLLSDSRCGSYMFHEHIGGIIMLGATIWEEGWSTLKRLKVKETNSCRNICTKTFGSFAVLYHRTTFKPILSWLNTTTDDPHDFVFAHLGRLGYPVRLAVPNLVIKDVTYRSCIHQPYYDAAYYDLKKRASIHRWNLNDYMFTRYIHT